MKKKKPQDEITTLLGEGARLEGELTFEGTVRIDGQLSGSARSAEATLIIGKGGAVEGEIHVANLVVIGSVKGSAAVSGLTRLTEGGVFEGELVTERFICEEGGIFNGSCVMGGPAGEPARKPDSVETPTRKRK